MVTLFLPFIVLPVLYLVALGVVALKRSPRGIATSLVFFAVAFAGGYWSITQSRSSTAALGFLWLPVLCTMVGFLGLAFGRWARAGAEAGPRRIFGWLALASAFVLIGVTVREGLRTRSRNQARESRYRAQVTEVVAARRQITEGLKRNRGRQRAFMDSIIRARMNDRAFLLAALDYDSISSGILDTLATSPDRGIALEAVRNPGTRAGTLTRVYEQKNYPDYFYPALAGNPNTPPEILRKLHHNPGVVSNLDIWLAGNPGTPRDVLDKIATRTTEEHIITRLLQNPAVDCSLLGSIATALKRLSPAADNQNALRIGERLREEC